MDNVNYQEKELEALESIFGDEWKFDSHMNSYIMKISSDAELWLTLTSNYPLTSPPKYEYWAPKINKAQRSLINSEFKRIYEQFKGEPILFQWIQKFKDIVLEHNTKDNKRGNKTHKKTQIADNILLDITHGPVISDRKSTFQGHVCKISCVDDIKKFRETLLTNRKIAQAKHNVLAYRLKTNTKLITQDYSDDGENHAGGRLLHLLNMQDLQNVAVIVTRWYGGIQIGNDRFKHYNECARLALLEAGFTRKA